MRKIKVGSVKMPDKSSVWKKHKLYRLYIGNGQTFEFGSLRSCTAFQNEVSSAVNIAVHELNGFLSELHTLYRNYFFYFEDPGKRTKHHQIEKKIKNGLHAAEDFLDKLYRNTSGYSGPNLIFTFINHCLESLAAVVLALLEIALKRMDNAQKYRLKIIMKRLKYIKYTLYTF
jgi:hypothetical protein